MALTSTFMQVNALVGFLLPLVIAKIIHCSWSESTKKLLGVVACVVAAVVTSLAQNKLNLHDAAGSLIVIFTLTKTSYVSLWKGTTVATNRGQAKAPSGATV